MHLLVYGPGRLGTAIVGAATAAGWPAPAVVGRPVDGVQRQGGHGEPHEKGHRNRIGEGCRDQRRDDPHER